MGRKDKGKKVFQGKEDIIGKGMERNARTLYYVHHHGRSAR